MTTFRYVMEIKRNDDVVYRGVDDDLVGALDCLLASVGSSGDGESITSASEHVARLDIALRDGLDSFKKVSRR